MKLLHAELFFAAGISLTVRFTNSYYQILLFNSSNEGKNEEERKEKKKATVRTFWRDDALFQRRFRLLPGGQKDFFSLSNYVSLHSPPSLKQLPASAHFPGTAAQPGINLNCRGTFSPLSTLY